MSKRQAIGIFDSGIGGFTVLKHIRHQLPAEDILYVADSAYAPYGARPAEWILQRSRKICRYLVDRQVKAIVVACNTATAAAVDQLRREFDLPIIAMEPAVKPAVEATRSGVIGVLATAGTLESERYAALLERYGSKARVHQRICHHWVEQVEKGELEGDEVERMVREDIEPLLEAGADTLVLGCTHFPFLEPAIRAAIPPEVQIIDPAPAVARQLKLRLAEGDMLETGDAAGRLEIRSSDDLNHHRTRLQRLMDEALDLAFLPNI